MLYLVTERGTVVLGSKRPGGLWDVKGLEYCSASVRPYTGTVYKSLRATSFASEGDLWTGDCKPYQGVSGADIKTVADRYPEFWEKFEVVDGVKISPFVAALSGDGPIDVEEDRGYEHIKHPDHYNQYSFEVIDMMELIWGPEKLAVYCEINAFKYRLRLGNKPDQPVERDLEKARWYEKKRKELLQRAPSTDKQQDNKD